MNLALKSENLYDVATGVKIRPEGEESNQAVSDWIKKDLEAQTLIGLNVSSNIATKIANCTLSSQMMKKLETLYGKKTEVTVERLREQFFSFKYDEGKFVVGNALKIQQLAEDLIAEGDEMKESLIMTRTLGVLSPKLHHFPQVGIMHHPLIKI